MTNSERTAVVGLGYVGLPLAVAFGRKFPGTIGYDIDVDRIEELKQGKDVTGQFQADELLNAEIMLVSNPAQLESASFFAITVPTPIDSQNKPDLESLIAASRTVGRAIRPGSVVVVESTVYPGVTEEVCGPVIASESGLVQGRDFKLGYSPERINPGDSEHTLERVIKVVSGEDDETLERVSRVYSEIADAGIHRAPSIRVAEAAKVIENTQRDLNIALVNEIAIICSKLGLRTEDVLAAARTKWNFLPFRPGLVGGHCIGVDPYYLTTKAEEAGYRPEVILAGRRINSGMGPFIAQMTIKLLVERDILIEEAKTGILGFSFKENVPDFRNSRVPDILHELKQFNVDTLVFDPLVDGRKAETEYGITLASEEAFRNLDALILAVTHDVFLDDINANLERWLKPEGVLVDVRSALDPGKLPLGLRYWSL